MADERLIQRVLGQQPAKLTNQVGVPAKLQFAFDALANCSAAFLLEAAARSLATQSPRIPASAWPRHSPSASRRSKGFRTGTAAHALTTLRSEGLIISVRGKG